MDERTVYIKKGSVGSFLQGILFGAAIALLVAPRSGRETRDMLTERGYELRDKSTEIARDTRVRASSALSDARNKLNDQVKSVKQGISETTSEGTKDLKRELEITEDMNNPYHNL